MLGVHIVLGATYKSNPHFPSSQKVCFVLFCFCTVVAYFLDYYFFPLKLES